MELTEIQMFVIATLASVIVYVLKLAKVAEKPAWLTVLVYVVSLGLAWLFAPVAFPPLPPSGDVATYIPAIIDWVGALLVPLSAFVGFATLIYNALLKQVLDKYLAPFLKREEPALPQE